MAVGQIITDFKPIMAVGQKPTEQAEIITDFQPIQEVTDFQPIQEGIELIPSHKVWPGPKVRPPITEQMKVFSTIEHRPALISEEIRKRAIEVQRWKKYGYVSEREAEFGGIRSLPFSVGRMISNVPDNIEDIVKSFSSLMIGTGRLTYKFGKSLISDANTLIRGALLDEELPQEWEGEKFIRPAKEFTTDLIRAIYYDWKAMFAGEAPKEIKEHPVGQAIDYLYEKVERQGLKNTILYFIQDKPIDALLLGYSIKRAMGSGLRVTLEGVEKAIPKGTKIAESLDNILSVKRSPIVYSLPVVEEGVTKAEKVIKFPRQYSKDPLIKYIQQKTFDTILKEFPNLEKALAEHKAKKLLNTLRNTYEEATFQERALMHKEIFSKINTLTKEEQRLIVPYLEGRLSLIQEPSEKFKQFEAWYRNLVQKVETHMLTMGKLSDEVIRERLYQPLAKATGLTTEQVIQELGDFVPAYVHHTFPKVYEARRSIHFAETTGKRFMPGFLKKSKGVAGYSEDLKQILPKWYSEYVKLKNTEAFLQEFTKKFGVRVNIKDVKAVEGGLKVGEKVYPGYKIVAPDGYLSFYKGKVDFYKEVSKRLENSTFDEAIGDALADLFVGLEKPYVGVAKNRIVYLVPEKMTKELESFATPFMGSAKAQDIVRLVVDKPTQVWKDTVLAITPRWIKNNVIGDIIFNSFEGVGPLSYGRGFMALYRDVIPDELLKASFANVMKYNPQLGNTAKTTIGKLVDDLYNSGVVQNIAKIKDVGYALNTMFEQPFVRSLYISLARKEAIRMLKAEKLPVNEVNILNKMRVIKENPKLAEPLINKVKETLPVFNITGNFERKYIRRFVPFYNWYKFMLKYGAKLPENHPFKLVGARGLGALTEEQREQAFIEAFPFMKEEIEENGIPDRYAHLWPLGGVDEEGKATFFNARGMNPFVTIESFANFDVVNMLSPVIKVPIERATGIEAFTGRKYTTGEEGVEYKEFRKVAPPLAKHILSQFPQYTLLEQILTPAKQWDSGTIFNPDPILNKHTGAYEYPIDSIEKILNYAGIDRKTVDIVESWENYQKKKREAIAETFKKYQTKSKTSLSFEEIRELFNELKKDTKKWEAMKEQMKRELELKRKEKERLKEQIEIETQRR